MDLGGGGGMTPFGLAKLRWDSSCEESIGDGICFG